MKAIPYGIKRTTKMPYEQALERLVQALKEEGFGILTEIDVKETLKKKLDKEFRRYKILGACNPPFAYQAITAETDIGLFMPCNVIVYETDEGGSVVAAVDPMRTFATVANPAVGPIAEQVRVKLERAIERAAAG